MPTPIAAVVSDIHLERNAYASHPNMWGDSYFALKQVVDFANSRHVPVIAAGDIMECGHPDAGTVAVLVDELRRLENRFLYVQGQHDMSRGGTWPDAAGLFRVGHLDRTVTPLGWDGETGVHDGVVIAGLDFCQPPVFRERMKALAGNREKPVVLVAHQVWADFMGQRIAELQMLEVPDQFKMLITGDYHVHRAFVSDMRRDLTVLSPGATSLQSLSEDPRKFFFLLNDDLSYESVALRTRPFANLIVQDAASFKREVDRMYVPNGLIGGGDLPENVRSGMLVVRFPAGAFDPLAELHPEQRANLHVFLRPFSPEVTKIFADPTMKPLSHSMAGMLAEYATSVGADPNSPEIREAQFLVESGNVKDAAALIVDRMMRDNSAKILEDEPCV